LSLSDAAFLYFLPLLCYDLFISKWQYALLLGLIPLGAGFTSLGIENGIFVAVFIVLAYLLKRRNTAMEKMKKQYLNLRDTSAEFSMQFEQKNKELMEKQDYEVHLATLHERNRIARDIHDNVGHVLSRSILQTGALLATCKDPQLKEQLSVLNETLKSGMDSIRESIHGLHEESIDLYAEAQTLTKGFAFCPVSFDYDVEGNPDKKIKYALLAVLKEALSNIMRHSNATEVHIALREHPAMYQLVVRDNGKKFEPVGEGLGLKNIRQRVEALKGIVNISHENGFTVFVSIPKEK
jgi:signal transduction histidine kinase